MVGSACRKGRIEVVKSVCRKGRIEVVGIVIEVVGIVCGEDKSCRTRGDSFSDEGVGSRE